jgi:hypothetical protein
MLQCATVQYSDSAVPNLAQLNKALISDCRVCVCDPGSNCSAHFLSLPYDTRKRKAKKAGGGSRGMYYCYYSPIPNNIKQHQIKVELSC